MRASIPILFLAPLAAAQAPAPELPPPDAPAPQAAVPSFHFGDFDGDAAVDVFVAGSGGSRLLRNGGAAGFQDVTTLCGLPAGLRADAGLWQDVDADGDLDLLTIRRDGPARLWANDGRGLFLDVTAGSGLADSSADLAARFVDVDGDGLVDLHRTTPAGDRLDLNLGGGQFAQVRLATPSGSIYPSGSGSGGTLGVTCTKAVADEANPASCIPASSIPMLGMLYPISADWFIDDLGRVGVGTITPGFRLDVEGDVRASGQLVSDTTSGPPLAVASDELVTGLNADRLDGLEASAFSQLGDSIESAEITDATITQADLANGSVSTNELELFAVTNTRLQDGAVSTAKLEDGAVTNAKLAPDAVTSNRIAPEAVSTSDIKNGSVTAAKLAGNAVTTGAILDGEVRTADLRNVSVTGAKIAPDAVDGSHVDDHSLTGDDIAFFSLEYANLASPLASGTSGAVLWLQNESTQTQGHALYATTTATGDAAVEALALDNGSGVTYGVFAASASSAGTGVRGRCTGTNGNNYGVRGETLSSSGKGVAGENLALSGAPVGTQGEVVAPSGRGVYGRHDSTSGAGQGVRGWTNSPDGWGVYASGDLGASGTKSFVQPHPGDASKEIRFVCLEGNESGTYFRGRTQLVDGRAEIEVPEDFRLVSESEGLTCQVTAVGAPTLTWIESIDLERIVVRGNVDAELHYFVNGVRRGHADFRTVRENTSFVPEHRGVPYGNQYPRAYRQILVENGILKADFTPDEDTAALLGWTLREPEEDLE